MRIHIKYFGQIAEITQIEEEHLSFNGNRISELLDVLKLKYKCLEHKEFQVAQNKEISSLNDVVTGTEIALLPPFSGG